MIDGVGGEIWGVGGYDEFVDFVVGGGLYDCYVGD